MTAIDKTMYNITLIWDGNCVEVQDRYSNLARLYNRLDDGLAEAHTLISIHEPTLFPKFTSKDIPTFPQKLLIHTEERLARRQREIERCLEFLFSNNLIQELLEYVVSTDLSQYC